MITEVEGPIAVSTPKVTRYRRHPLPFKDASIGQGHREKVCERTKGHVLITNPKGILCLECGAEWHDYQH